MAEKIKRPDPKEGQIYKHFKGSLYEVVAIAVHTESSERLVIYRSVEKSERVFARPLDMFMSEVDRFRYPFVKAKYRFTLEAEVAGADSIDEQDNKKDEFVVKDSKINDETEKEIVNTTESEIEQEIISEPKIEQEQKVPSEEKNESELKIDSVQVVDYDSAIYKDDGTLALDPVVEAILDEKDFTKKIESYELLRGKCTDEMLTTLAISLDVQLSGESIDEKYAEILKTLRMHEKYESARFR